MARINHLTSIKKIHAEMRKVYREARGGTIPIQDGKDLYYMLKILSETLKTGDLEERIEALEAGIK